MKKEIRKYRTVKQAELRAIGRLKLKAFKVRKRKEMRDVVKAYAKFRSGCAGVPGYSWARAEGLDLAILKWLDEMKQKDGWSVL